MTMSDLKNQIDLSRVPQHVAVIMDGNGRWAKLHQRERLFGHANGVQSVRDVTQAAVEVGVKYLTLYTFSTENWNRPKEEVDGLMNILVENIVKETPTFHKNHIRLRTIGNTELLPEKARQLLDKCMDETKNYDTLNLVLALSYSSRAEINNAVRNIAKEVADGLINPEDITDNLISNHLYTHNIPDPDLLIRTSGEIRISNFLLWQIAYSELYFIDTLWPDFRKDDFFKAIINYQQRERRFGKISEQLI